MSSKARLCSQAEQKSVLCQGPLCGCSGRGQRLLPDSAGLSWPSTTMVPRRQGRLLQQSSRINRKFFLQAFPLNILIFLRQSSRRPLPDFFQRFNWFHKRTACIFQFSISRMGRGYSSPGRYSHGAVCSAVFNAAIHFGCFVPPPSVVICIPPHSAASARANVWSITLLC